MNYNEEESQQNNKITVRDEATIFLWEVIKFIVISLAIIIPLRFFVIQPFFVRGASMESTFENNDYILIDEISYRFTEPKRGEVIVFRSPEDTSQFFIKRIIALPSEEIVIKDNSVTIYNKENPEGMLLNEAYLSEFQRTEGFHRVKLDANEYYVLGDNRTQSSDSRRWGAVNETLIIGRAFIKVLPISQFGKVNLPEY